MMLVKPHSQFADPKDLFFSMVKEDHRHTQKTSPLQRTERRKEVCFYPKMDFPRKCPAKNEFFKIGILVEISLLL